MFRIFKFVFVFKSIHIFENFFIQNYRLLKDLFWSMDEIELLVFNSRLIANSTRFTSNCASLFLFLNCRVAWLECFVFSKFAGLYLSGKIWGSLFHIEIIGGKIPWLINTLLWRNCHLHVVTHRPTGTIAIFFLGSLILNLIWAVLFFNHRYRCRLLRIDIDW